ncbi:MAG: methyltransferase domain-containing protein, partial [Pseudomonadota bacterium]
MPLTDHDALEEAYMAALKHEKAGRFHEAKPFYEQCLVLDPDDHVGASVRLAAMGLAKAPDTSPTAYMEQLFNQFADQFDEILIEKLGYSVPMQLEQWFRANKPGPYRRMVDLGCGTGLVGMLMTDMCEHATGVDIAEKMIEASDGRAAYDELFVNEVVHFLQEYAKSDNPAYQPFDLFVTADMLPYIGALEPLFDGIAANAAPGATLAFSCEGLPNLNEGWSITPQHRFAHSKKYLEQMCARAGFLNIDLCEVI